jgi:hypothetical protein
MDPGIAVMLIVAGLAALGLVALRYGRDSRRPCDPGRDWW